jgi:hypothetical protein
MADKHIWTWLQAKGKIFKLISDPDKGTIEVRNEKGETLIRKTNLSRKQVEKPERNFLNLIANKEVKESYDPMIA